MTGSTLRPLHLVAVDVPTSSQLGCVANVAIIRFWYDEVSP